MKCEICREKEANVQYVSLPSERVYHFCEECCEKILRDKEALEDLIMKSQRKFHYEIEVKGETR